MEDADAPFLGGLDFKGAPEQARGLINEWVSEHTQSRVPELIPSGGLDPSTRLVPVNAVYFKAGWETPFEKKETRPAPFHVSKADERLVPMMRNTSKRPFVSRAGLKAVELGYQSSALSMLLVLPNAREGLAALEASLDLDQLDAIVKVLRPRKVALSLPRFDVRPDSLRLGTMLRTMGMTAAFDPHRADFTGIARSEDPQDRLFLGEVYHQAFVKVDEEGTEAAAATAGALTSVGIEPDEEVVEFNADHPFLFLIRDETTGLVVFMGRVTDPHAR